MFKKIFSYLKVHKNLPIYSSRSIIVLSFIHRIMIHVELTVVFWCKVGVKVHFTSPQISGIIF